LHRIAHRRVEHADIQQFRRRVGTFRTIYPGWYAGRATHIHVEVFVNGAVVKTTQIAFPEDISSAVSPATRRADTRRR
jgi:protocatechuate 3,4-dioxygenase beta subunit